jgi:hypothetical protein
MNEPELTVDFTGLGAPKAGSTWLAEMLDQHPAICMSEPKEVSYFNRIQPFHGRNPNFDRPRSWYGKHFSHCPGTALKGEFSTCYLWDAEAPRAIHAHNPAIKLIVCLRDPVSRAYSSYWMKRQYHRIEPRDTFEEAIRHSPYYLELGLYHRQLRSYLRYFDRAQFHVVFLEDIQRAPAAVLRGLYTFLGVDPGFEPAGFARRRNAAARMRYRWAIPLMDRVSRALVDARLSGLARLVKRLGMKRAFMRIASEEAAYPPLDPAVRAALLPYFRADIAGLEELLGRDLSAWRSQ